MVAPVSQNIFVALDTRDLDQAVAVARGLSGLITHIKLGMEFFYANGQDGVKRLVEQVTAHHGTAPTIFLDLKLHDIPNTVAAGVTALSALPVDYLTVHAAGGAEMLRRAQQAATDAATLYRREAPLKLLGVTVMTSLDKQDFTPFSHDLAGTDAMVIALALRCRETGLHGLIVSGREIAIIRNGAAGDMCLVVPGIRPAMASADDQKRVMTPAEAIHNGADFLVIGRPITRAPDPRAAAQAICDEIDAG